MRTLLILIIFLALTLSACFSQTEINIPSTQTQMPTLDSSPTTQSTSQVQSSKTPQPPKTTTMISIGTPTFDVQSLITHTPATPEECPELANVPLPDLSVDINNYSFSFAPRDKKVLDYLNQGGSTSNLIALLRKSWPSNEIFTKNEVMKDLTGDGVPELLIIPSDLYIFGCQAGKYHLLFTHINDAVTMNGIEQQLVAIQDLNLNGTPEIVFAIFGCGGFSSGQCLDVYIYEWNGTQFVSLIPIWEGFEVGVSMIGGRLREYLPDAQIQDIDGNGTFELILTGDIPNSWYFEYFKYHPWRDKSDIYMWNGKHFVLYRTVFSMPTYRYQAVQDGDRATFNNEYEKALSLYQEVIFNENLLGWSSAHKEHYILLHQYTWDPAYQTTPIPVIPPDDPQEYPNLAAYAWFRIMLIQVLQGHMVEAQTAYQTLQEKYPQGQSGHTFALVAKAFWEEYQISISISDACKKAVSVATKNIEVLRFLGSDYHNIDQDILYKRIDVCPF